MFERIMPFVGLGIFILLLVVAIVFLSYVFIIGAIIGLILYCIAWIRQRIQGKPATTSFEQKSHGNVYDHDQIN